MHKDLKVKRADLEQAEDVYDYLYVILPKYYKLWDAESDDVLDNFTDDQLALLAYITLYDQVQNGGFLQLLFNGYGDYIFNSPLVDTLEEWGVSELADILRKIKPASLEIKDKVRTKDSSLEDFSNIYTQYPEFDSYDDEFYHNDGILQVKSYVENHLNDFVIIE